jgi:monodehydroascorbate reductase (NADH)
MSSSVAKKIVVVGGGVSAGYFARAIVAAGRGADLTIISAEPVAPYERPALTKAVLHAESPARLPGFHTCVGGGGERQTEAWYADKGVTLRLGTRVVGWDASSRTVTADDGAVTPYDALVVAIGCTALRLPEAIGGSLPGVHYVRDNADALALSDAMATAKAPVVIGGGYIGLEAAAALAARGLNPRVVLMEPHTMARLWTPEVAAKYEALYESKGVVFHRGARVKRVVAGADGRVDGVELEDGAVLPADLVVVGVGAGAPSAPFDALRTTPDPKRPGGIAVDHIFAASGADIAPRSVFAVGDVAAFPARDGVSAAPSPTRVEHVAHARASAAHCARAVLDDKFEAPYEYLPFFYSRVFEQKDQPRAVNWAFWGFNRGACVCVGDFAPSMAAFWVDEADDGTGKVAGVMVESCSDAERDAAKRAAASRTTVDIAALRKCASVAEAFALIAA